MCLAYLLTVILSKFCENTNHFFPNFAKYLHGITFQLTNKSTYPRCFKRHKVTLNIDHFKTPISKFPHYSFTLSDLLFQINLKHLLSISFLFFSGTTQALATYVNIGTIKDLVIKIFPKIVKFLFVHKSNKLFIFSILFSQFNF